MTTKRKLGFNPKVAVGRLKAPLRLVPSSLIVYTAIVQELGAEKYSAYNWREHKVSRVTYLEAILRHTLLALNGEDADPESGVPHEGHIAACCAIILDALTIGRLADDRYKTGTVKGLMEMAKVRCAEIRARHAEKPKPKGRAR